MGGNNVKGSSTTIDLTTFTLFESSGDSEDGEKTIVISSNDHHNDDDQDDAQSSCSYDHIRGGGGGGRDHQVMVAAVMTEDAKATLAAAEKEEDEEDGDCADSYDYKVAPRRRNYDQCSSCHERRRSKCNNNTCADSDMEANRESDRQFWESCLAS